MDLETLAQEAQATLRVSAEAADRYRALKSVLLEHLNRDMIALPGITGLVGGNPRSVMFDNHRNHVDFMEIVFRFNAFHMLCGTLPWVYRAYRARGFSYDYFPVELQTWQAVLTEHLEPESAAELLAVYDFMHRHHDHWILLSGAVAEVPEPYPEFQAQRRAFRAGLLAADYAGCLELARSVLAQGQGLERLYLALIQPVMYEIGRLWEADEISTAEEHLATSLVSRILASLYGHLDVPAPERGRAVVSCAPNEFHELGGRMLADLLEREGWDVLFLGANTPPDQLLAFLRKHQPSFLALSLTMPFGLQDAADCIAALRRDELLKDLKVLVGGLAFAQEPELWRSVGADGWAADPQTALRIVRGWQADAPC